ncbi:MAG: LPS export ABC transporter periplasmic protein LptC [Rubrivivax sp.]
MALELHLPDLPDVPISLGPVPHVPQPPSAPLPWHRRARELLGTYLPLLLMAVLALGTWWLVKNTPAAESPRDAAAPRSEPDYTMSDFVVERFDKDGRLKARIQGEQLRHYADTDRIEVDQARVRAVAADGRATLAQARRAITTGDGSEVQLVGDARITSTGPRGEPIEFRGEFLHAFLNTERVRSHLPVVVVRDGSEFHAAGMDYDHLAGLLQLQGRMRALLLPSTGGNRSPKEPAAAPGKKGP